MSAIGDVSRQKFICMRDELEISGTVFMPEGKTDCPIAVISHAFMANQVFSFVHAHTLAKMGYAVFCFDFCGGSVVFGKSEGETTEMSVMTQVRDLKAVIDFAKGYENTDSEELLLLGCSQGGFVSAITAAELQEEVDELVLLYPALCIPDDARSGKMMLAEFDPENVPEILDCGPMKLGAIYVNDVIDTDAFELISGYKGRVLIIQGDDDDIVDISYAERALKVYEDSGADVRLKVVEGGGHIFLNPIHSYQAMSYVRQFVLEE